MPKHSSQSSPTSLNLKTLKGAIYKNKYFPEKYLPKKTKLLNTILAEEKERLHIKDSILESEDEEQIAETVRQELLDSEKKIIFYDNQRPKLPKSIGINKKNQIESKKVPFIFLEEHRLKRMMLDLELQDNPSESQKQLKHCLQCMYPKQRAIWTSPAYFIKAINECLLTRNWNTLTHLLLEFIHLTDRTYKPIIKHAYQIMDKLHPVINENDLQGEFKNIQTFHKKILHDTTIV